MAKKITKMCLWDFAEGTMTCMEYHHFEAAGSYYAHLDDYQENISEPPTAILVNSPIFSLPFDGHEALNAMRRGRKNLLFEFEQFPKTLYKLVKKEEYTCCEWGPSGDPSVRFEFKQISGKISR